MSNILLKHLLLKTAGNVGASALGAAAQAQAEKKAATASGLGARGRRKAGVPCTPCAARGLVASVQKKVFG
jgi:hypothetical protein